jgi:hypothetical protein
MVQLVRHPQTKERDTYRLNLNHAPPLDSTLLVTVASWDGFRCQAAPERASPPAKVIATTPTRIRHNPIP